MATKLIARAEKASAWQAAIDYAGEKFKGSNLAYVTAEINRAKLERQPVLTAEPATVLSSLTISSRPCIGTVFSVWGNRLDLLEWSHSLRGIP